MSQCCTLPIIGALEGGGVLAINSVTDPRGDATQPQVIRVWTGARKKKKNP